MVSGTKLRALAVACGIALGGCLGNGSNGVPPVPPGECVEIAFSDKDMTLKNTCSQVVHANGGKDGNLEIPAMGSITISRQIVTGFTFSEP